MSFVGCPHFKTTVRKIRGSNYNTSIALTDIIDNIILKPNCGEISVEVEFMTDSTQIRGYIIHDDYDAGFEHIDLPGPANPFNMGHEREGHEDDNETSQFGCGMKDSFIFLGNNIQVTTRAVSSSGILFKRVKIDIDRMCERPDPILSFEPEFQTITETEYQLEHPFKTGSTIRIADLNTHTDRGFDGDTREDVLKLLRKNFSIAYSDIENEIDIRVNDVLVEREDNIFDHEECRDKMITYHFKVVIDRNRVPNTIKSIYGKKECKRTTYFVYDPDTGKHQQDDAKLYETRIDGRGIVCVTASLLATTTHDTELEDIQHNAITFVKRKGRCHGAVRYVKPDGDGYCNHIYTELRYDSKLLNPFIGLGSSKVIVDGRKNDFTMLLASIVKNCKTALKKKKTVEYAVQPTVTTFFAAPLRNETVVQMEPTVTVLPHQVVPATVLPEDPVVPATVLPHPIVHVDVPRELTVPLTETIHLSAIEESSESSDEEVAVDLEAQFELATTWREFASKYRKEINEYMEQNGYNH